MDNNLQEELKRLAEMRSASIIEAVQRLKNSLESIIGYKITTAYDVANGMIFLNKKLTQVKILTTASGEQFKFELLWDKPSLYGAVTETIAVLDWLDFSKKVSAKYQVYLDANPQFKNPTYLHYVAIEEVLLTYKDQPSL